MFIQKNLKFISIFAGAFILFAICPVKANPTDLSAANSQSITYTNTGTSNSTTGYGMSSGDQSVTAPSTSTDVQLSLTMPKYVAMAINTTASATTTPGGPFAAATVPRSQFAVRSDINDLKTNSVPEFIIKGLVASNVDNVKLDFSETLALTNGVNGSFDLAFTGFKGAGATGYDDVVALVSGDNISTASGVGGFRLEGNIAPGSVSFSADRSGSYTGTLSLTATAL